MEVAFKGQEEKNLNHNDIRHMHSVMKSIVHVLKDKLKAEVLCRKQESIMTRLQIVHTWITHSYLLKKEDQPVCHACDSPFTVKNILIECPGFTHIRNKFYTTTDVPTLF